MAMRVHKADWKAWMGHWIEPRIVCDLVVKYRQNRIDCWVVPKNAENKEAAEKWINFLCRPDIAKKNFDYITYSTPNTGAYELSDEELQNNEALFPDMDSPAMKNSEILRYLGDGTDNIYNEMWKEVKVQKISCQNLFFREFYQ